MDRKDFRGEGLRARGRLKREDRGTPEAMVVSGVPHVTDRLKGGESAYTLTGGQLATLLRKLSIYGAVAGTDVFEFLLDGKRLTLDLTSVTLREDFAHAMHGGSGDVDATYFETKEDSGTTRAIPGFGGVRFDIPSSAGTKENYVKWDKEFGASENIDIEFNLADINAPARSGGYPEETANIFCGVWQASDHHFGIYYYGSSIVLGRQDGALGILHDNFTVGSSYTFTAEEQAKITAGAMDLRLTYDYTSGATEMFYRFPGDGVWTSAGSGTLSANLQSLKGPCVGIRRAVDNDACGFTCKGIELASEPTAGNGTLPPWMKPVATKVGVQDWLAKHIKDILPGTTTVINGSVLEVTPAPGQDMSLEVLQAPVAAAMLDPQSKPLAVYKVQVLGEYADPACVSLDINGTQYYYDIPAPSSASTLIAEAFDGTNGTDPSAARYTKDQGAGGLIQHNGTDLTFTANSEVISLTPKFYWKRVDNNPGPPALEAIVNFDAGADITGAGPAFKFGLSVAGGWGIFMFENDGLGYAAGYSGADSEIGGSVAGQLTPTAGITGGQIKVILTDLGGGSARLEGFWKDATMDWTSMGTDDTAVVATGAVLAPVLKANGDVGGLKVTSYTVDGPVLEDSVGDPWTDLDGGVPGPVIDDTMADLLSQLQTAGFLADLVDHTLYLTELPTNPLTLGEGVSHSDGDLALNVTALDTDTKDADAPEPTYVDGDPGCLWVANSHTVSGCKAYKLDPSDMSCVAEIDLDTADTTLPFVDSSMYADATDLYVRHYGSGWGTLRKVNIATPATTSEMARNLDGMNGENSKILDICGHPTDSAHAHVYAVTTDSDNNQKIFKVLKSNLTVAASYGTTKGVELDNPTKVTFDGTTLFVWDETLKRVIELNASDMTRKRVHATGHLFDTTLNAAGQSFWGATTNNVSQLAADEHFLYVANYGIGDGPSIFKYPKDSLKPQNEVAFGMDHSSLDPTDSNIKIDAINCNGMVPRNGKLYWGDSILKGVRKFDAYSGLIDANGRQDLSATNFTDLDGGLGVGF